jgi:tRNA-Thr(GGU) m(6)t(6)A37 methyltransferase TsaA
MQITFTPIGYVHSDYKDKKTMPRQPRSSENAAAKIKVLPEYQPGLKDLDGFSHIIVIFNFHKSDGFNLMTHPPFEKAGEIGVFASRSPYRPNAIGLSTVRLLKVEEGELHIEGHDLLDGTPVLDIKPYLPDFDEPQQFQIGWLADAGEQL